MTTRKRDTVLRYSLVDNVTSGLKKITSSLSDFGASLLKVTGIAGAASAALGAFGATKFFSGAVESAGNLEEALARIGAVTGSTVEQLAGVRKEIRAAAEGAGISTAEAAKSVEALARAGLSANESVAALGPTLALARAGALSAADAAGLLADTLDQYGLAGDKAAQAADTLAAAALRSGTGVAQIASAFVAAAPAARELGLSLEQAAAAVGLLAKEGIEGSKAGAALRNVFSQLQDPASKFRQELQALGITSTDFSEVIVQLAARGQSAQAAIQALGTGGTAAVQALLRQGGPALAEFADLIAKSGGAAQEAADRVQDSYKFALEDLKARVEDLRAELLAPILGPLADELGNLSDEVKEFVASDDFAKLQTALLALFKDATAAAKEFVAEVDFSELTAKIATFAEGAGKQLGEIAKDVGEVASALETAVDAVGLGIDGLTTTLAGAGTVIATGAAKAHSAIEPLSNDAGVLRRAFEQIADSLGETFDRNVEQVVEGMADLRGEAEAAGAATEGMAAKVTTAGTAATAAATQIFSLAKSEQVAGEAAVAATPRLTEFESVTAGVGDTVIRIAGQLEQVREAFTRLQAAGADPAILAPVQARIEALTAELAAAKDQADLTREALRAAGQTPLPEVQKLSQTLADTAQRASDVADEGERAGKAIESSADASTSAVGAVSTALQELNARFAATSEAARQLFIFLQRLGATGETSIFGFERAMVEAAAATQRAIDEQKAGLESLIGLYDEFADKGADSLIAVVDSGRLGELQMRALADAVRTGDAAFKILSDRDLERLAASIDRAAQKSRALTEETRQAAQALAALNRELLDEADRNAGNEEAIAKRQFEDRVRQIEELARTAGLEGAKAAADAKRQAEANYKAELDRIRARREEERSAHRERMSELAAERDASGAGPAAAGGGVTGPANRRQPLEPAPGPRGPIVNVNLDGATIIGDPTPAALERLAGPLERVLNQRQALRR